MAIQTILSSEEIRTTSLTKINSNFTELNNWKANLSWANFTGAVNVAWNVWIWTTSPWDYYWEMNNLVVWDESTANNWITIASNITSRCALAFADGTSWTSEFSWLINYNHSNDSMHFSTNGGWYNWDLSINSSWKVWIWTTDPNYTLDVNGSFWFTPWSAVTPISNWDVVFQATSNTVLTVKMKWTDWTIRTGTINLS